MYVSAVRLANALGGMDVSLLLSRHLLACSVIWRKRESVRMFIWNGRYSVL